MAALSTQRASELNPLIEDESMLAIKMGIICVVILLYALAKDKHLSWQRPLEQGVQLGTVLVWVVVLSNLFTVSSTL